MSLQPGSHLGPYEVLASLGAGGMGEVWKAKDTRLDRFVAIKVLPEHLAKSPESLARFEREAKAVAALNHPNITGIFDIGKAEGTAYVAMELLEGESLRTRLEQGPLTPRKATELAIQMAQGLAAAHEKGVIHRDLKPDNLWITKEGRLKILDFGLAKQLPTLGQGSDSYLPTAAISPEHHTEKGMILGTLGYMSPEQVRGEAVDARADLFSFGVVLFEMLTGKKPFARQTASDTMAAILRDDPPELEGTSRSIPLALRRIIDHCLEKASSRRFRDAQDLAFALENLSSPEGSAPITTPFAPRNLRATRIWAALVAVLLAGVGFGAWTLRGSFEPKPTFKRLTFGKGTVDAARFAPNSLDIIFSARWNGADPEIFSLNPNSMEPRALGITGASLMSVSASGELAVRQKPRIWAAMQVGALARVTPGGGSRTIMSDVIDADWMSGGTELATLRGAAASRKTPSLTEFPPGHPVQGLAAYDWGLRVSPKGDRMACLDQSSVAHGDGRVVVVDRAGHITVLTVVKGFTGLAWGPKGDEVWYSETRNGTTSIWAVSLSGHKRLLLRQAGRLELLDVGPDGQALAALGLVLSGTMGLRAPDFREQDLSWNEATITLDIAPDGKSLLLGNELWDTEGNHHSLYLRKFDGSLPVLLGEAADAGFMPSGSEVFTLPSQATKQMTVLPLGPGQPRDIHFQEGVLGMTISVLPDGKRALIELNNGSMRMAQLSDGSSHLIKGSDSPNFSFTRFLGDHPLSPAGDRVLLTDTSKGVLDGAMYIVPLDGSAPIPIRGQAPGDIPMRWDADGKSIYVFNRDGLPARINRIELTSGKRTLVREIMPSNPAGLAGIRSIAMTPDARTLAYNYVRKLSDLYLIEGLK